MSTSNYDRHATRLLGRAHAELRRADVWLVNTVNDVEPRHVAVPWHYKVDEILASLDSARRYVERARKLVDGKPDIESIDECSCDLEVPVSCCAVHGEYRDDEPVASRKAPALTGTDHAGRPTGRDDLAGMIDELGGRHGAA